MNSNERSALSRTLSKILRHSAVEEILMIRSDGFINFAALLARSKLRSLKATFERVQEVFKKDNKTRFTLREESGEYWVRANQGHSIVVDDLEVTEIVDPLEFPNVVHGHIYLVEHRIQHGVRTLQFAASHSSPDEWQSRLRCPNSTSR